MDRMSVLTENVVLSRTRNQDMRFVKKLNCWGCDLTDVSIVRRLPNVEVIAFSVNNINTLEPFAACKNLQELYLRQNKIKDINELVYLMDLPYLRSLWLAENPCAEFPNYRMTVLKALPNLEILDNIKVTPEEVRDAEREGNDLFTDDGNQEETIQESNYSKIHQPNYSSEEPEYQPTQFTSSSSSSSTNTYQIKRSVSPAYDPPQVNLSSQQASNSINQTPRNHQISMHKSNSLSDYNLYNGSGLSGQNGDVMSPNVTHYGVIPSSASHERSTSGSARLLPKGGKNRNANILSAVLCLIKELDFSSLEVVDTAIHCRMEELEN